VVQTTVAPQRCSITNATIRRSGSAATHRSPYSTLAGSDEAWTNELPLLLPIAAIAGAIVARRRTSTLPAATTDDAERSSALSEVHTVAR
jgi:hypothetical protein